MNDEQYTGWDGPGEEAPATDTETPEIEETEESQGEPETEEAGVEEDAGPVEPVYAGKYKTVEDLERSYQELERKLGERERAERQQAQATQEPDEDIRESIARMPVSKLTVESGPWDQWVQETYGYEPSDMSEADWLEVKTDIKNDYREQRELEKQQYVQLQTLDQQVTTAFSAEFPQVMQSPALTAAAKAVTAELWAEIQTGVRVFEGPEQFARLIGETLKQQLGSVGPVAMGAYNAQRQTKPRQTVPSGGVTPTNAGRQTFDPDKYRGWNGPKD